MPALPRQALTRFLPPGPLDATRTRVARELRHNQPLLGCRFDPSGRYVFAGGQDNQIQRWELANGNRIALTEHQSWVRGLAFHGDRLISSDYQGQIIIWPVAAANPTPDLTLNAHRGWVRAVAVSPDGRTLASCGNDNLVKLWSLPEGRLTRALEGHRWHVYNVAFHPGGEFLVSADLRGNLKQWNLQNGRETRALDASVLYHYDTTFRADIGGVRSMAFNRDGSLLACAGITEVTNAFAGVGKPAVVLFDWHTGNRTQVLRGPANFQGTAWGTICHPTGFIAGACGGNGGALYFWRPNQAQPFHAMSLPNNARDLDLHPDGRRLAIPFFDNAVRIYDLAPPQG